MIILYYWQIRNPFFLSPTGSCSISNKSGYPQYCFQTLQDYQGSAVNRHADRRVALATALIKSSLFKTVTSFKEVIRARSFGHLTALDRSDNCLLHPVCKLTKLQKSHPALRACAKLPVHAKIVATEFVDVSSPFRYL